MVLRVAFIYVVWLLGCLLFELKKKHWERLNVLWLTAFTIK